MEINNLVTRKKYNHDIIFQIIAKKNDIYYLKGVNYRLVADSYIDDLTIVDKEIEFYLPHLNIDRNLMNGRVLHLDGDKFYVRIADMVYRKYSILAKCVYVEEYMMQNAINSILRNEKFDVLVITGHDFKKVVNNRSKEDLTRYENSINFVGAVMQARRLFPSLDDLVIVAGACQSSYEALMQSGANFASSPKRENIHMLDPIIVAILIATTSIKEYVSPNEIVNKTISHSLGGIESKGKARLYYAGVIRNDYNS